MVNRHKGYLVVEVGSRRGDAVELAMQATRVVASVAASMDAAGVFWIGAAMLVDRTKFLETSKDMTATKPPAGLWVNFLPGTLPEVGPVVHTIGLSALDFPEIILAQTGITEESALELILGISEQVLQNRVVLRRGDTFRLRTGEKLVADEVPAPWKTGEVAVLLVLKSAARTP
jgi:hypothetical protein